MECTSQPSMLGQTDDLDGVAHVDNTTLDTTGSNGAAAGDGEDVLNRHQEGQRILTLGGLDPGVDSVHQLLDAGILGSNSGAALGWNVKIVPQGDNKNARVFVHSPSGSFGGADALTVAVLVLGRWK